MVQATAEAIMRRLMNSKTRPATELLELKPDDRVDYYRKPSVKDEGWRGPADVVRIEDDGHVTVNHQSRHLRVRGQDVRRALEFLTSSCSTLDIGQASPQ